jgi:hypothetical protein
VDPNLPSLFLDFDAHPGPGTEPLFHRVELKPVLVAAVLLDVEARPRQALVGTLSVPFVPVVTET